MTTAEWGQFKYFSVEQIPPTSGRKLPTFDIINNRAGDVLGEIKWYGAWRQWAVFAEGSTVWSDSCLDDLKTAIGRIKAEHSTKAWRDIY